MEADRIEHERNVKERMEKIDLEQLMLKCNKEILESERKIVDENRKTLNSMESSKDTVKSAYINESRLFDEINYIMQQPSQESLHKVQLMVNCSNACFFNFLVGLHYILLKNLVSNFNTKFVFALSKISGLQIKI